MKLFMKILTSLFGAFWIIFGVNNFLHFFPIPEPSDQGAEFMKALDNTGYALPIIYGTQILAGVLLLIRKFVPLALCLLAPIILNIALYDLFLNPSGLVIGSSICALFAAVLFDQKDRLKPLLTP